MSLFVEILKYILLGVAGVAIGASIYKFFQQQLGWGKRRKKR